MASSAGLPLFDLWPVTVRVCTSHHISGGQIIGALDKISMFVLQSLASAAKRAQCILIMRHVCSTYMVVLPYILFNCHMSLTFVQRPLQLCLPTDGMARCHWGSSRPQPCTVALALGMLEMRQYNNEGKATLAQEGGKERQQLVDY